jgi:predicted alpha-1,2-mannosidase
LGGAWGSGYRYETDTIKGFSHIHGWQIAGVSVLPVTYSDDPKSVMNDYFSPFSHNREIAKVGYHKVDLERYGITAQLTSTHRVGFHKYTFTNDENRGVIFQLSGKLGPSDMIEGKLVQIDNRTLNGEIINAPTRRRPKNFKVFYVVKLDKDISEIILNEEKNALVKFSNNPSEVKMKVGISYTSYENAMQNIKEELPNWDFEIVVEDSKREWDQLLGRIKIMGDDSIQISRFYTDLWHGLQGRRTISDVNGAYPDNTGKVFKIGQIPLNENGKPTFRHFNSDSFWGAQWTINTLWGILYPEIYSEFVLSLMRYYRDGGLVPRGPSGGNYTYVMTGASSTPFIISAFQKGINIGDPEEVYNALKKNHMPKGIMAKAGYEHKTNLGGGLDYYIKNNYVPYPIPEGKFGYHQDGASLTLEYAYQDFTLAQMAKSLSKMEDYRYFMQRSKNYQYVFDTSSGWVRPKNLAGEWKEPFDPYQYENGFNESNGAQGTWFVGHDINGLAALMGGKEKAIERLNQQFETAAKTNFTAGSSHERGENPDLARVPINYGNQPSIQTAYIFQALGRPDLTQYWATQIVEKTFGGLSPFTGYNGDEDQGLMGSLAVIMKLGLFQLNGGTEADPIYCISSPLFDSVSLMLHDNKELAISKEGKGNFIDKIVFNGEVLQNLTIRHSELMTGGKLLLKMKEATIK